MNERQQYIRRQARGAAIYMAVVATVALGFVLFSLVAWTFGFPEHLQSDVFKFSLLAIGFSILFFFVLFWIYALLILVTSKME